MSDNQQSPQKNLNELMGALEAIQSVVDDCEEITPEMIALHFDAVQEVDQKTDRLIGFIERMKAEAAIASEKAEQYTTKAKRLENAADRAKDYAKFLLQKFPDLTFRGKLGQISLHKSSVPKTIYHLPFTSFASKYVLPADSSVPEEFTQLVVSRVLDTEKVKEAIKQNHKPDFVDQEFSHHIRIKV